MIFSKLLKALKRDQKLKRLAYGFRVCFQDPMLYPLNRYPSFDAEKCADAFLINQREIQRHVADQGGIALSFLQPANGFGRRVMSARDHAGCAILSRRKTVDGLSEMEAIQTVYRKILQAPKKADFRFVDLTECFDSRSGEIYLDQAHPSNRGYDLIARRMAHEIHSA